MAEVTSPYRRSGAREIIEAMNRTRIAEAHCGAIRVVELELILSAHGIGFSTDAARDQYYVCAKAGDIVHFYPDGTRHAGKLPRCKTPQEYVEALDRVPTL